MHQSNTPTEMVIMHKIRRMEFLRVITYLGVRSGITFLSILSCIGITQLITEIIAEKSVLQVFNFSDMDDELVRRFIIGEFFSTLQEIPLIYWVTIAIGVIVGILVSAQIIRRIPYLGRKLNAIRRI